MIKHIGAVVAGIGIVTNVNANVADIGWLGLLGAGLIGAGLMSMTFNW